MKNIGNVVGLYPMPVTVVGTEIEGKVNWINIAHVGIVGVNTMLLSMGKSHYSNQGIIKNKTVSVSLVSSEMLVEADYVGIASGKNSDKSNVFEVFKGQLEGAPLIKNAPLTMECEVVDIYDSGMHDNFIIKPINTFVDEKYLDEVGRIDYASMSPVLFAMQKQAYLSTGERIGDAWKEGREYPGGQDE